MMSVIVLLSSLRSSSMGPGMGSCCLRCSALRICCLFCQIVSASFSHLTHAHKHRHVRIRPNYRHCKQVLCLYCTLLIKKNVQQEVSLQQNIKEQINRIVKNNISIPDCTGGTVFFKNSKENTAKYGMRSLKMRHVSPCLSSSTLLGANKLW